MPIDFRRLKRKVFARHANPWSAWTRWLSAPLVLVPVWNRSWGQGALVGAWMAVNPVVFPEPADDTAFATRAMLGEEIWIEERPKDAAMAANAVATAAAAGALFAARRRRGLAAGVATAVQLAAIMAYWRRMAAYYERHRRESPPPERR